MGTDTFAIMRRYYPHALNYDDKHEEAAWRPVERRLDFDRTLCALVLVDVWSTNEIGFDRIDRIVRERITPLVHACREAGILVVHAPSPPVAGKYADRRFKPSRPEDWLFHRESDGWPTDEMLAGSGPFAKYSLRMDDPDAHRPGSQEELYRNYFIHPALGPEGDDVVVGDREELHALLKDRGKFHLFYGGFASNGCMLERDYGVKWVSYLGYDVTLLRDCTGATEMAHTLGTLEQTRASTENMEFWISSCRSTDFLAGLRRMRQTAHEPVDPPVSRTGKRRRIIVNDDGEPLFHEKDPEAFLAKRFRQTVGTQVDTYIIYAGDGWHPHRGRRPDPGLGDPYQVLVDAAHNEGMEIFASLRMNDIHCSFDGSVRPLKRERPDLLIGEEFAFQAYPHLFPGETVLPAGGYPLGLMQSFWAGYNYAKPDVRELRRARVEELARAYDFDGIELDFFRAPLFFKPGEERQNLATMTGLVRQIRGNLNEIATQRGRPYLLAVRVPDTLAMSLRTGLDVRTWLEEGLVDILIIAGGYMPFSPRIKELIDLAHFHDIPAYPSVDIDAWYSEEEKVYKASPARDMRHPNAFDSHCEPDKVRAIASNFRALGADGVYLFNWYGLPDGADEQLAVLDQVGELGTLRNSPKRFQPDNGTDDWLTFCGYGVAPRRFPVRLVHGTPVELFVGDDVRRAAADATLRSVELRIEVAHMHVSEGIDVSINGVPVPAAEIRRTHEGEFRAGVSAPPLRQGVNEIVALPGKGSIGRSSTEVTWMDLSVRYR